MLKAFAGQDKFSGDYEEDLDNILQMSDTFADMCDLTPNQKRNEMPLMLQ